MATNTTKKECEFKAESEAARSLDEMIEAFKLLESRFQENELAAFQCWKTAHEFHTKGENPEKVISFGKRALKILLNNNNVVNHYRSTMFVSCVLNLMGFASFELKRFHESLGYLNWANKNLCKLDQDCELVSLTLLATQLCLFEVKFVMGDKREESVVHLEKVLSIKERMMVEDCVELGEANRDVCCGYIAVMNFEAALPYGLKALEIYTNHFGYGSVQSAEIRRLLGVVYHTLGDHDKAMELNQSSMSVLKEMGCSSEVMLAAEIGRGSMLIGRGKNEEAIKCLKAVVSNSETKDDDRALALVTMAKASCYMDKFEKAKKYMKIAHEILERKETDPLKAAVGFGDMSVVYEMMGDFETALLLLRRVLTMPELPQRLLVDGSTRLFSLIPLAGKENEGITYLEDVVEKLKASLGPEHSQVGYCYATLVETCRRLRRVRETIKYLPLAKDVLDVSLGPNHLVSLKISHSVARLYTAMWRLDEAMAIQEKVVEGLRDLVPGEQAFMDEAVRVLEEIKGRKNSWCSIL